jgi:nitrite reductase (NADH) large subunit
MDQGRIAGANMAGQETPYQGTVPANTLKVVGIDLLAAGEIDAEGKMEAIVQKEEAKGIYRKLVLKDQVIIGAILLGNLQGSEEIQKAIKSGKEISSLKRDLANKGFDSSRWP